MWTCKRCETLNEDDYDSCALCNEPKSVKEEQQHTSNGNSFSANKQQSNQYQQSFSANNPRKESEPRKKSRLAILIGVLCVLLLGAVIAIVVLVSRQSVYQGVAQATEPPTSLAETMAPKGDVTLTVESTGDYLANLIPTDETCNQSDAYIGGMTYDANTVHVSIYDCRLINKDGIGLGTMLPGALIQLTNLDTQTTWEKTQNSDSMIEPFTGLPSGKYQYTVSKAGYITYTSPTFELNYVSGADNEYVWASYSLIEEASVFSNGFQIQITDLAGNPVASKKFNTISLIAFDSTEEFIRCSSIILGDKIDEDGMITSDGWAPTNLFALKKGSVAIISFDDDLTWNQGVITGQCIVIRAN